MALDYHRMRLRHARLALLLALRRWGIYLLLPALALSAGVPDALLGLPALLALPLLGGAVELAAAPGWAGSADWLMAAVAMALIALLPLVLARPLWWPRAWAQQEQALPLSDAERRASDLRLLGWFVVPPLALPALGLALWLLRAGPAAAAATAVLAGLGWVLALLLALTLAMALMGWTRRCAARPGRFIAATARPDALAAVRPRHWSHALLWLPLRRRAGRGSALLLLLGGAAMPALAASPWAGPAVQGPGLAVLALLSLPLVALLRQRLRQMQAPWHAACAALPLAGRQLDRATAAVALLPLLLALPVLVVTLAGVGARAVPALLYLLVLIESSLFQALASDAEATATRALRWLLCAALLCATAWESVPA